MSSSAQREQEHGVEPSRRASHRPLLSVILLSRGDITTLANALESVAERCRRMEAQVIVVRAGQGSEGAALESVFSPVTFLFAPADSPASAMRAMGMASAKGDIVALHMDDDVGDARWLDAFRLTVGTVDEERPMEVEVALATSVEYAPGGTDRRRARASSLGGSASVPSPKRRSDFGRASSGFADVASLGPTLEAEM